MNRIDNSGEDEQLVMAEDRTLPGASFPREYILGVFIDLQDAKQAADTLRRSGFSKQEIHVLEGPDFMEAVSQDQSPFNLVTSMNHDDYLVEMNRGRSFLAVRPANFAQLTQIRDLLAPHGAYLVRYIDTWSQRDLLP